LIFSLAHSLGFRLHSPHNGNQPRYLADSLPEVISLPEHSKEKPFDRTQFESALALAEPKLLSPALERLEAGGCVYLSATNTFLVREFRIPSAAAEATRFLHHACKRNGSMHPSLAARLEDALAHFGLRLLCPEAQDESAQNELGEAIYRAYLEGRITKVTLRKMFLTDFNWQEQVETTLQPERFA
jgi:hypothetical protein